MSVWGYAELVVDDVSYGGHFDSLNPAANDRQIADPQTVLLTLAKDKTEQLYPAAIPTALPDIRTGIRIKTS